MTEIKWVEVRLCLYLPFGSLNRLEIKILWKLVFGSRENYVLELKIIENVIILFWIRSHFYPN